MLMLKRKKDESLTIAGQINIEILSSVGIDAPKHIRIQRDEFKTRTTLKKI